MPPTTDVPTTGGPRPAALALGVLGVVLVLVVGALGVGFLVVGRTPPATPVADASGAASFAASTPLLLPVDASVDAPPDAPAKPPPLTAEELDALPGDYTCRLDDTAAFACRISGGQLEKLAGSQRFRGSAKKLPNGNIEFSGTFFCPFGDCTRPVATTFVRQGPGRYVGKFAASDARGSGGGGERVTLVKVR